MGVKVISIVLVPAQSYALANLDDVLQELGLQADADGYIAKLITRCSAAILRHCNTVVAPERVRNLILPDPDADPLVVPGGIDPLQLSRAPISEVVSVVEAGRMLTQDADFLVDPAPGQLIRISESGMPIDWSMLPIVVTFEAGGAVPPDLEDAAIRLVKSRYFARGRDPMLRSENIPGVREASWWVSASSEDGNFPPDVADILSSYRTPVFA